MKGSFNLTTNNISAPVPFNTAQDSEDDCEINAANRFLIAGYVLVIVIGLTGNSLVILMLRTTRKRSNIDLLIIYLAFFDILSSIFGPFVFLYWTLTCHKAWHFGEIGCKILPTLSRIFTDMSIGIILMMAIDRCRAIVTPFKSKFKHGTIHLGVFATIILSISLEGYYINALYTLDGKCKVLKVDQKEYAIPLVIFTGLRNLVFIVIFSTTISLIYWRLKTSLGNMLVGRMYASSMKRRTRVIKMLIAMAFVFSMTVMPRDFLHLVYIASWLDSKDGIDSPGLNLTNNILKLIQVSNSIYNVFIYGKMHTKFLNRLKEHFVRQPTNDETAV